MKKAILIIIVLLLTSSCRSNKPIETKTVEKTTEKEAEKTEVKKVTEISKAIKDSTATYLPDLKTDQGKDCDSSCNEKYREALKAINFYKKSGENSYKMFYNNETKMLHTIAEMQELISTKNDSINTLKKIKSSTTETVKPIIIVKYPRLLVYLAICGVIALVYRAWRIYLFFSKP